MNRFVEVVLKNWDQLHTLADRLIFSVFRGQADSSWPLSTSLERYLDQAEDFTEDTAYCEHLMLDQIKRKSQLYMSSMPAPDDDVEWLAILQHHGCPTRLLDFSWSPYVATYFAVIEGHNDAALWALDWRIPRDRLAARFNVQYHTGAKDEVDRRHVALANRFVGFREPSHKSAAVIPFEPQRLTERMSRQKGLFVMPSRGDWPFMKNLWAAYGAKATSSQSLAPLAISDVLNINFFSDKYCPYVLKIILPADLRAAAIRNLSQMNITAETLFGGLDGFAKSLAQTVILT